MNTLIAVTSTLAYLAFPGELYIPVTVQPNGDYRFFIHEDHILDFKNERNCVAYLSGIARERAHKA